MRLLHAGFFDARDQCAGEVPADRRRGSDRHAGLQPVPLHRLSEHHQGGARGARSVARRKGYGRVSAASAAFATSTSCSIFAPPAATAPMTSPPTSIGKPPGTLVKSPMRTDMLSAFSSGAYPVASRCDAAVMALRWVVMIE